MHTKEEIVKSMFEQPQVTEEELAKSKERLDAMDFHVTLKDLMKKPKRGHSLIITEAEAQKRMSEGTWFQGSKDIIFKQ